MSVIKCLICHICLANLFFRLELALRDSFKRCNTYDRATTLMNGLFYFYKKSHNNQRGLRMAFQAMGVKGVQPPRVGGTRWVGHVATGISALLRNFPALHAHLSSLSHNNAKAEGLCKLLTSKSVLNFLLFLKVKEMTCFIIIKFLNISL